DARRVMPAYSKQRFHRWFEKRRAAKPAPQPRSAEIENGDGVAATPVAARDAKRVALFVDTWTQFNEPGPGKAAVEVLERLGYQVELVRYGCCGRPQISKGLLREAQGMAKRNVASLQSYVEQG